MVPTFVGLCTLSNIYLLLGFSWVIHISIAVSIIVLFLYLLKIATNINIVSNEYSNTILASLYSGITMLIMIIGSYIFEFNIVLGKYIWFIGIILHALHIIVFTYRNVIKKFNILTFIPSWFVTYNGIMVSTVVGISMNEPMISKIIVYYGITILFIIMPFMIYRLLKYEIKDDAYHIQAIVLAPSSLCVVSYINIIRNPNNTLLYLLYIVVLLSLAFVLYKLPKFFEYKFSPGFAGLTFPMPIGIVASVKISGFLDKQGYKILSVIIKEISGIQIFITTGIITFVIFNFMTMLRNNFKED
ncbi:TDT family transporter [Romboutsia sp. Marseille-P6047]|uniref:TDT family transporter n=1 Tax=Romboutsia sp. Marseille-P6047 TaxID=2161817 RepID=UPI0024312E47|nr:TDT family transporter [Romboutsia sp. Marseille-P6047]